MALVLVVGLAGCGSDEPERATKASAAEVTVVAHDYRFDVPATVRGGLVDVSLRNAGAEPHFVDIATMTPEATLTDVKAALSPPPGSPAPATTGPALFERFAGVSTMDPGRTGKATLNLPAGRYAFFCRLPSPDGIRHVAKGMITEVTVTEAPDGDLPEAVGTIVATDFAYAGVPTLTAGTRVVRLLNAGGQFHEINLVEVAAGGTIDDVVAWFKHPIGAPPMKSVGGASIRPGRETAATIQLEPGSHYAFVCGIPDVLGDRALHVTKGMFTPVFAVG
ncbi:MAG: hypothetical protein ACRDZ3_15295 [Acidimicrobiia bacterium]